MSADISDYAVLYKAVSEAENEDDDVYSNLLRSANFQVTLIPVLDFEFVNLDKLFEELRNPHRYEGIIFTSPRCVTAVELSIRDGGDTSVLEKWQEHKHFVVGEKTAQMTEKLGFVSNGKEAGNAKNLAEIISKGQYRKPFLYPKGSLTKDSFKSSLKDCIDVNDITVYTTQPHSQLETNIRNIKSNFSRKTVCFIYFSPSGVNFTLPLLEKHQFDINDIKFVAIGPTTEEALKERGLKVASVAAKPDPHALLDAVLALKRN